MRFTEFLNKINPSLQERAEFERGLYDLFESFIKDPKTYSIDLNHLLEELEYYSLPFERVYLSKGARIDTEMIITICLQKYYVRYTPNYDFYICREIIHFEKTKDIIKKQYDFIKGNNL